MIKQRTIIQYQRVCRQCDQPSPWIASIAEVTAWLNGHLQYDCPFREGAADGLCWWADAPDWLPGDVQRVHPEISFAYCNRRPEDTVWVDEQIQLGLCALHLPLYRRFYKEYDDPLEAGGPEW